MKLLRFIHLLNFMALPVQTGMSDLNLSQFTVKHHISRVMRQVEAASRYDAVELIRATGHLLEH